MSLSSKLLPFELLPSQLIPDSFLPPSPREVLKKLPQAALQPFVYSPFPLQKLLLSKALFRFFEQALSEGDLDFLKGKWLKIDVSDLGLSWLFSCGDSREVLVKKIGSHDVCIRGGLKSFVLLAAQKEDPDTLFFQRDLVIEGDTDLGLEIKNLLDSLEHDELPPEALFVMRTAAEYLTLFSSN